MVMNSQSATIDMRLKHAYGDFDLDVDLRLPATGVTVLFGPSGSGKTSLLRFLAGLARAQQGRLQVTGAVWQDETNFIPTHLRPIGYVFQEASLLPHLSVEANLLYALKRVTKDGATLQDEESEQVLSLLGIKPLLKRQPEQLSGGERQRVAIARALLSQPEVLLMDEPLASLDQQRKREIIPYLEKLRTELAIPIIYVTHSLAELSRLADTVVVLEAGRVVTSGPTSEVLTHLDSPLQLNDEAGVVIEASVISHEERWHLLRAGFVGGEMWLADEGIAIGEAIRVRVMARDVSITLSQHEDSSILNTLPARILEIAEAAVPGALLVKLVLIGSGEAVENGNSTVLVSRITQRSAEHLKLVEGMSVWAQIKSMAVLR